MFARDLGVDLGTASVIVFVRGRGVVIREPAVVAMEQESGRILAVGQEAREMIGRTPGNIVAIRPLKEGVIANYDVTETMLKYFIQRASGRRPLLRPQVVVCVPSRVTSVERRAVLEACMQAGAKRVFMIAEPMAAAIGAGLDISEPNGKMVVDIGGGTTDVAVISLGGEVVSDSLRVGGDKFDEAIVRYVRREFNLLIGERTAEEVKIRIGSASPPGGDEVPSMEIKGRDTVTGLPRTVTLDAAQVHQALEEPVRAILDVIRSVLEKTPPELSSDIIDRGIVLTGGGSLLTGLSDLIARETGIPAHLADDPLSCVALGTGKVLETLDRLPADVILASRTS